MPVERPVLGDGWMVARLPENVQAYLAQVGICRNEATPMADKIKANERQLELLEQMTPDDMFSLVGYVCWKKERMTPDPKGVQ